MVPCLISLILLVLPLFWLGSEVSLGGDDSRLFLVFPWAWLREFAVSAYGTADSGFGNYNPQQLSIPFTAVLAAVGQILPGLNLEAFAFGIALATGFAGVYASALILILEEGEIASPRQVAAACIGGLAFVLAPLMATMYWDDPFGWVVGIGGAPVLVALASAYVASSHMRHLLTFALLSPIFAVGLAVVPVSLPLACVGAAVVCLVASRRSTRGAWKAVLVVSAVTVGAHAFWIIPFLISISVPGALGNWSIAASDTVEIIVHAVSNGQSVLFTLMLLPSGTFMRNFDWSALQLWTWYGALAPLSLLLPVTILLGIRRALGCGRDIKMVLGTLGVATLLLAYCQTVNLGPAAVQLFILVSERVPGFAMFRNFYGKFAAGYTFCYCLLLANCVALLLSRMRVTWRRVGVCCVTGVIVLQGVPMLLGRPLRLPLFLPNDGDEPVTQVGHLPPSFLSSLSYLRQVGGDSRVLELPLSANYWSVIPMAEPHALYLGIPPIPLLTGLDDFNSIGSFSSPRFPELLREMAVATDRRDYAAVGAILRLVGIRYILYTDGVSETIRAKWLKSPSYPQSAADMGSLAAAIGAVKVKDFADAGGTHREIYAVPALPRLFAASRVRMVASRSDILAVLGPTATIPDGSAVPVSSTLGDVGNTTYVVADMPDGDALKQAAKLTPWHYQVRVDAAQPTLVVFLEPYDAAWVAQAVPPGGRDATMLRKIPVNGYASAWLLPSAGNYTIELNYTLQMYNWLSASISVGTLGLVACLSLGITVRRRIIGRASRHPSARAVLDVDARRNAEPPQ